MKYYLSSPSGRSFGFELDTEEVEIKVDENRKMLSFYFENNNVILKLKYSELVDNALNYYVNTEHEITEEQLKFFRNNSYNFHQLVKKV